MNVVKSIKVLFVCWSLIQSSFVFASLGDSRNYETETTVAPCPVESAWAFSSFLDPLINFFNGAKCNALQETLASAEVESDPTGERLCRVMLESPTTDMCMDYSITAEERRDFNARIEEKQNENNELREKAIISKRETLLKLAESVRLSEAIYSDAEAIANYGLANGLTYEKSLEVIQSCVADNIADILSPEKACEGGDSSEIKHFTDTMTDVEGSCSTSGSFADCGFIEKQNATTLESVAFPPSASTGLIGHIVDSSRYYGVLLPSELRTPYMARTMSVPMPLNPLAIIPTASAEININNVKEQMHLLVGRMLTRVGDNHPRFKTNEDVFNHVYNLATLADGEDIDQLVRFVNMGGEDLPENERFGALSLMRNMSPRINFSNEDWKNQLLNDKILKASFSNIEEAYNSLGGSTVIKDQETLNSALANFKLRKTNEVVANCAAARSDITNNFCGRVPSAEVSEAMVSEMNLSDATISRTDLVDARLHCWNIRRNNDIRRVTHSREAGDDRRRLRLCQNFDNLTNIIFSEDASSEMNTSIDMCSSGRTQNTVLNNTLANSERPVGEAGVPTAEQLASYLLMGEMVNNGIRHETTKLKKNSLQNIVKNLSKNATAGSAAGDTSSRLTGATIGAGIGISRRGFSAGRPVENIINDRVEEILEQDPSTMTPESRALLDELSSMRDKLNSLESRLNAKQTELEESRNSEEPSAAVVDGSLASEIEELNAELAKARLEASELLRKQEASVPTALASTAGTVRSVSGISSIASTPAPASAALHDNVSTGAGFSHAATGVQASAGSTDLVADVLGTNFSFSASGGFVSSNAVERTREQVSELEQISGYNVNVILQKVSGGDQVVVETDEGIKLLCEKNETEENGISCKTLSIVEELSLPNGSEVESPLRVDPSRRVYRADGLEDAIQNGVSP